MEVQVSIAHVTADEVLDSRGNPTVEATVILSDGSRASATVPSGASTGQSEARELRDCDTSRYGGRGVRQVVQNVCGPVANVLRGIVADDQWRIDAMLAGLDGTEFKSNLGANTLLGVSIACARVAAKSCGLPLFRYLGGESAHVLPVPMLNILNGGLHARGGPDIQEFMIVPLGAPTVREALRAAVETYHALRAVLTDWNASTNLGDEGGYVPRLASNEFALDAIMTAIERAGYKPGYDIALALDFAASSLRRDGVYHLPLDGLALTSADMIDYCSRLLDRYPIVSIEDPLADDDWHGYQALTARLGHRVQIVGDDLFVSNRAFLLRGMREHCCNGVLIKPNQVGTITETLDTARMAIMSGYATPVSHRSGETEDTSIADLAVALNCGQIKAGAPARGERVAKYNRLLEIERMLGSRAAYRGKDAFPRWRDGRQREADGVADLA
ncbi:phosphopyruvate hydratase [Burkholderia anthina]|uniref:phosphopyruvate hydratase n=1 Tax=Burkholderia anthina TaxID=179879 RepID=UPI001AA09DB7|nr:phosphopyruvate hydratase [Burkholderia anthina]QTD88270.1 phosphopyruvate hydratase [Burkholderia anthina]